MRHVVIGLWVFAALGCGRINETYKAEVDRRVATLRASAESYARQDAEPPPLAAGQWVEFKLTGANKRPGFAKYQIVGQEGSAFWVETELTTYTGKQESRMLIYFGDRIHPETMQVKSATLRNDGRIIEYPPGTMNLMQAMWKPILRNFIIDWADAPREDATVPAGQFAGCYKRRITVSAGPYHQVGDAWLHPAIPINGMVRSVSVGNNQSITELIAFGNEGATSTFPPQAPSEAPPQAAEANAQR